MPPPFDALWFRVVVGLIVGLALGSFVTMLSYRLPRRMSIVTPRSHCPVCKHVLTPPELVPVLSWAAQRAACLACKNPIGWRYPLTELAVALLTMAAFALIGFTFLLLLPIGLIIGLVTAIIIALEK